MRSIIRRLVVLVVCMLAAAIFAATMHAQKRKNKKDEEPKPQVLEILPEPPEAITAETGRISFQISPLSAKGLLSQQIRDALKAVSRLNHGAQIVHLRAFVAGSGDLRRVKEIVAEEFTGKKQPLPSITTLQAGALPLAGAQVVLEAVSSEKRTVNPNGVAFVAANAADAEAAVAALQKNSSAAGLNPADILRVTCFVSAIDTAGKVRASAALNFPNAAINIVQPQRLALEPGGQCTAAARLGAPPAEPIVHLNSAILVSVPKLILSGGQLVFQDQDADFRLAFTRIEKALAGAGAGLGDVIWSDLYAMTKPQAAKFEAIRAELLGKHGAPAGAAMLVEGLPSIDATGALDVIAAAR